MSDTPRVDAVFKAAKELPFGSCVEIPKNYPPCDPWELARSLEKENKMLKRDLDKLLSQLESANKALYDR